MVRYIEDQNRVILFMKRHFMDVELVTAIVFSLIMLFILLPRALGTTPVDIWVSSIKTGLYPVVATISGALLGFVITGVSIILAFSESDKLKRVRNSKQYPTVYKVYFRAIKYLAITTVLSVLGIVINSYSTIWFYLLFIFSVISILGLYQCIWTLERITGIVHKEKKN